uniref:Chromosome 5 open reading frame 47 n=1 Tax=Sciurus vulgaris TaxID=55149 RepID=A0A8D2CUV2_SCIVU
MAPAGRGQQRARARFVYVTRFGSHQCGGVLQLGGPRAPGRGCPGPETCGGRQEPREAAAEAPSGGELPAGRAGSSRLRASSAPGRPGPAGGVAGARAAKQRGPRASAGPRACVIQKDAAKKFDFPIPVNEASKIMKKRKKVSVWNRVYKIISRMLEENEKYRLRLECQKLSSESKLT